MITANGIQEAHLFLLVTERQYAVAVYAERTREDLQIVDDDLEDIWLMDRQALNLPIFQ